MYAGGAASSLGPGSALTAAGFEPSAPAFSKPAKTFLHLTTTVDSLAFSPDAQVRKKCRTGLEWYPVSQGKTGIARTCFRSSVPSQCPSMFRSLTGAIWLEAPLALPSNRYNSNT